jgi:hypothetical protein
VIVEVQADTPVPICTEAALSASNHMTRFAIDRGVNVAITDRELTDREPAETAENVIR